VRQRAELAYRGPVVSTGMRILATAALAALTAACSGQATFQDVATPAEGRLVYLKIDNTTRYLIDPRSHTCALIRLQSGGDDSLAVDCAVLAANVPEAAQVITWVQAPVGTPVEVPPPAAPADTPPAPPPTTP